MPSPEDNKNPYNSWTRERLIAELERVSNEFGLRWDKRQVDRNFEEEQRTSLVVLDHDVQHSVGDAPTRTCSSKATTSTHCVTCR